MTKNKKGGNFLIIAMSVMTLLSIVNLWLAIDQYSASQNSAAVIYSYPN